MTTSRIDRAFTRQEENAEESLQDILVKARARKGLRSEDVALAIGAAKPSWILFETRGRRHVSLERILAAAELLEVDPYLICYKMGIIHPDMQDKLLESWPLYDGARKALGLGS